MEARRGWEVISPFQDAGGRKEGSGKEGGRRAREGWRAREEVEDRVFISTRMDATRHLGFNEGNCTGSRLMWECMAEGVKRGQEILAWHGSAEGCMMLEGEVFLRHKFDLPSVVKLVSTIQHV